MNKLFFALILSASLIVSACGNASNEQTSTITATDTVIKMTEDTLSAKSYDVKILDNKKDPTCGMPVTAGVSDTAHFQNKIIGFCSSECKAAFIENPTANIAAAELK
jgi:YHS domain-containing protein